MHTRLTKNKNKGDTDTQPSSQIFPPGSIVVVAVVHHMYYTITLFFLV